MKVSRVIILLCCLTAGSAVSDVARAASDREDVRPNVLFLFADDQRPDTIAALGNPIIRTPNLDRLSRSGVSFTARTCRAASTAQPVCRRVPCCCPASRCSTSTSNSSAMRHGQPRLAAPATPHLTWQVAQRGQISIGQLSDRPLGFRWWNDRPSEGEPQRPQGRRIDSAVSRQRTCMRFCRRSHSLPPRRKVGPFLCYVPFDAPHDPHIVPDDFPVRYDAATIPLPANFLPQHPFDNGEMKIRDEVLLPHPRPPAEVVR